MTHPILRSCLLAATVLLALPAFAQAPTVTSTLQAQRVEEASGKPVRKPVHTVKPGDIVEYSGTYRNSGTAAAARLLATIPVPAGTTFVAASADPASAQASTDGSRFAPMPLMRSVRQADGTTRQEPVPLAEYRFVRWEIGTLPAGRETVVAMRVRVDAAESVAGKP